MNVVIYDMTKYRAKKLLSESIRNSRLERMNKSIEAKRLKFRQLGWKKYGILNTDGNSFTLNDYNRLFQIQGGRCAFKTCNKHQSELERSLVVDHDHATGIVRGLLCSNCNHNLVNRHTLESALALIDYLKRL